MPLRSVSQMFMAKINLLTKKFSKFLGSPSADFDLLDWAKIDVFRQITDELAISSVNRRGLGDGLGGLTACYTIRCVLSNVGGILFFFVDIGKFPMFFHFHI